MDQLKEMQAGIAELENHISLRQIALQSKINYITLRNIKGGKSQRVTSGVSSRFKEFKDVFDPSKVDKKLSRRGRKPKAAVAMPAATAAAPTTATTTAPAPKAAVAIAPKAAAAPKRKPGRPKKSIAAAVPAKAVVKKKRKYTRKAGKKAVNVQVKPVKTVSMLGGALKNEIAATEARLDYLKKMQKAEADYQKALGNK